MRILYHCTKRNNLKKILEDGLVPRKPDILFDDAVAGVYLSENPFDWMHRATDETTVAGAMIEVDVSCLELIGDGNIFWTDGYKLSDKEFFHSFIYKQVIPPDRFVRIFVSTDGKPSCFREYKL